jgi:sugar (pentulose or hexulose) kinase
VQINPQAILDGAHSAIAQALDALPDNVAVTGLGITSMGETGVLVDGRGRPVAPAIAWQDTRDAAEVEAMARELGAANFSGTTGKPIRGQWALTKHRWLVDHQPAVSTAVRRFNVAEWVARSLGAEEACDRALACRTGWFDLLGNRWWDQSLAWSGAPVGLMPALVQSGEPIGRASGTGIHPRLRGAVLTLAGHDHQAAAVGAGAGGVDDELDSSGTAEALIRTVPTTLSRDQILALARRGVTTDVSIQPGRWSLLGGTEGGLAMQRALSVLGVSRDGLAALDDLALQAASGAVVVAGVGGAALELGGLTDGIGPGDVWRAVVEAATAQAVDLHHAMIDIVGPHRHLVAAGGWCNSTMVMSAKRAGFGALSVSDVAEAGALGAATLAARAAGQLGTTDVLGGPSSQPLA